MGTSIGQERHYVGTGLQRADAAPGPGAAGTSVLEAVLERITFVNEETGFMIARVATDRSGPDLMTVPGALLGAQVGESLRLSGRWTTHPRYGRQFDVHSYTTVLPATIQGIQRYLGSGLIKGRSRRACSTPCPRPPRMVIVSFRRPAW